MARKRHGLHHEPMPVSKLGSFTIRCSAFNVRFGSKADIRPQPRHVRFTPGSGHLAGPEECPLSAKSGPSAAAASPALPAHDGLRVGRTKQPRR